MTSFQTKEAELLAFLKKCNDLINLRASIPNFDEVADQYLGEGEKVEDDIDHIITSKSYPQEQLNSLTKLKADVGKILDQLESVDTPTSPKKPLAVSGPQATPAPVASHAVSTSVATSPQVVTSTPAPVIAAPPVIQQFAPLPQQQPVVPAVNGAIPTVSMMQMPTPRPLLNLRNKSGNEIWQVVKNNKQSPNEQIFEALKGAGAIPSGFRGSFLQNIISATNDHYTYANLLAPKATPHCLSFKDAAFGSGVGKILHHGSAEPKYLRLLTVTSCNNMISLSGTNVAEIMDRIIRVCLVDGERIISNIHTIRVSGTSDQEKRNWFFDTSVSNVSLGMQFGEMFLKCDSKSNNVSILFECAYVVRQMGTNDACMVSCGWYSQPLMENNEPVRKGNFEALLYGGIPMEFNVGLGAGNAPPPPAQRSKKPAPLKNSKEPYIMFKLADFNFERELIDTLPDTLIGCTLHLAAFDFYCDSLISTLGKREHPQWAGRIHNPFLSTFPGVADQPDIMDIVRILWMEANGKLTRQAKKDDKLVRSKFITTYLSLVIPALGSVILGNKFDWLRTLSNPQELQARQQELGAMMDVLRQNKSPFQLANVNFRPLQPNEYMLDLMSPNCFTVVY